MQLLGDFVCMRGDSLAVYEMERPGMPRKDDGRTATTTAHDNRHPASYGVFGGSEILVDAAKGETQGKRQEVFVHVDGDTPKNDQPLPLQPDPLPKTAPATPASATPTQTPVPTPGTFPDDPEGLIDDKSGISVEEQREILAQINGIGEKNRMALSTRTKKRFKAKKNGGRLPILVNALAIAALIGGFFALYTFQTEAYVQAREGARVFTPTERAIIAEIRRETSGLLGIKNLEIAILTSFLAEVEAQLGIIADSDTLTPEQLATYENLRVRQEELRAELALAQEERSRILNDARTQEIILLAHFNARTQVEMQLQEFAASGETPPPEQVAAYEQFLAQQEEFHAIQIRVRDERSRILSEARERETELRSQLEARNIIEAQLRELATGDEPLTPEQLAAYEQLRAQHQELGDAMASTWYERALILDGIREQDAELQAQLAAGIYDFDIRAHIPDFELEALNEEFAQLLTEHTQVERAETLISSLFASARRQIIENRFDEIEETIESLWGILNDPTFQAISAVQPRRELYSQVTDTLETLLARYHVANEAIRVGMLPPDREAEMRLEQEIATLVEELGVMENIINTMNIAETDSAHVVAQLEDTIDNLQSANMALNTQVGNQQSTIATLNTQVGNLQSANTALGTQVGNLQSANATLNAQVGSLQSANTALNTQVGNLQSANTALSTQVGNLQSANATLNAQVGNLQSEYAALNDRVGTLQENLDTQTQAVESLRQNVQSLRTVNTSLNNQLTELRRALASE